MARTKAQAQSVPTPTDDPDDDAIPGLLESLRTMGDGDSELPDILDIGPDGTFIRKSGKTPLEFLTAAYRHPLVGMKERVSAAKAVLEFTHRKPTSQGDGINPNTPLSIDMRLLSGLNDKELQALLTLLDKATGAQAVVPGTEQPSQAAQGSKK